MIQKSCLSLRSRENLGHVQSVMLVVFIPTCLVREFVLLVVMLCYFEFGVAICDVLLIHDVVS